MIARGFKPVAWVAAIGAAALGCYMLSLRVASERAELTGLERKIVNTQKSIRSLQTELDTRGRVTQLQQWNDEILALAPPSAGQFLDSQMMLTQFYMQPSPAIESPSEVRMAAAEAPAPAPAPVATPPAQRAVAAPPPAQPATVQRASLNVPPAPEPRAQPQRSPAEAAAQPARLRRASTDAKLRAAPPQRTTTAQVTPPRRPVAAQAPGRGRALLDERTVRDIGAESRSERRRGTRD